MAERKKNTYRVRCDAKLPLRIGTKVLKPGEIWEPAEEILLHEKHALQIARMVELKVLVECR